MVIPKAMRDAFQIADGTRALLTARPDGILLQPVTRWAVDRAAGSIPRKTPSQSFAAEWAAHKRAELKLEDGKYKRSTGSPARIPRSRTGR
jgi:bifunctional DNA-binding transcriptional regulator/antitoxin component of YhaV-PrlF toxin-antitoxin module